MRFPYKMTKNCIGWRNIILSLFIAQAFLFVLITNANTEGAVIKGNGKKIETRQDTKSIGVTGNSGVTPSGKGKDAFKNETTAVEGELIVKLSCSIEELFDNVNTRGVSANSLSITSAGGNSNAKQLAVAGQTYTISEIVPLFRGVGNGLSSNVDEQGSYGVQGSQSGAGGSNVVVVPRASNPTEAPSLNNIYKFKFEGGQKLDELTDICNRLKNDSRVLYAHPNYIFKVCAEPNDSYYSSSGTWGQSPAGYSYRDQWPLQRIDAPRGWDVAAQRYRQGYYRPVIVAVVDTGVDYNHPELQGCIWVNPSEDINHNGVVDDSDFNGIDDDGNGYIDDLRGWDFCNKDNNPIDDRGHGTHVAGTISSLTNNGTGIAGVAWIPVDNIVPDIMAVKGLDSEGSGSLNDLASAIFYAAYNGADIINMSWGGEFAISQANYPQLLNEAMDYARSKGCVLVISAGNSSSNINGVYTFIPACYEPGITVSATTSHYSMAPYSNFGDLVDVSAPGGDSNDILSLRANGTDMGARRYGPWTLIVPSATGIYYRANGTSMAAPHVSGLAALLMMTHPEYNDKAVMDTINNPNSVDDYFGEGRNSGYGWGCINIYKAMTTSVPLVVIISPHNGGIVRGNVNISGLVAGGAGQLSYRLKQSENGAWTTIGSNLNGSFFQVWDTTGLNDGDYIIKLNIPNITESRIAVKVANHIEIGWPRRVPFVASSTIAQIDDDSEYELIAVSRGAAAYMYVFEADGSIKPGWPVKISLFDDWTVFASIVEGVPPTVDDLDGDGQQEIILPVIYRLPYDEDSSNYSCRVYVWHSDGSMAVFNRGDDYPMHTHGNSYGGTFCAPVTVYDLDDDGDKEILLPAGGKVYTWEYNRGSPVPFAKADSEGILSVLCETNCKMSTIAVGNIDNCDTVDLVMSVCNSEKQLHVIKTDGSPLSGWPVTLTVGDTSENVLYYPAPTLGDINGDNYLEIAIGTFSGEVLLLNHRGGISWRRSTATTNPILASVTMADVDNDTKLEIIARGSGTDKNLYVLLSSDGSYKPGFPVLLGAETDTMEVLAGDIDGDSYKEMIAGSLGRMIGRNHDGTNVTGFPFYFEDVYITTPFSSTHELKPLRLAGIADVDNDGYIEIAYASGNNVYLSTIGGVVRKDALNWPIEHQNITRTRQIGEVHRSTVWVSPDGNDVTGTGERYAPVRTIQKGLSIVVNSGVVSVLPGIYVENVLINKPVLLTGEAEGGIYSAAVTHIHAASKTVNDGTVVLVQSPDVTIRGFHIYGGKVGIGVTTTTGQCPDIFNLNLTIVRNVIESNDDCEIKIFPVSGASRNNSYRIINNTIIGNGATAVGIYANEDKGNSMRSQIRNNIIANHVNEEILELGTIRQ